MECNKEEAVRAKQLAEKKMEIKDFSGALKIAVKAQQLYPAIENISQLILVCEVHCSAEKRLYGTDKDWYGILKVDPSADDTSIKKQYRKLALVLHPDKNSFAGATDAFKLIGEAQRVLLDREKRLIHDSKRRAFGNISASSFKQPTKQPTRQPNFQQVHSWNKGHSGNSNGGHSGSFQFQQQATNSPTGASGVNGHTSSTFWTECPFCSVRYQFYRNILKKDISCQNCKVSFTAYDLNTQGASAASTATKSQTRKPVNRASPKPTAEGVKRTFNTKPVFEKKEPVKTQGNVNRKRKKRVEESSESGDSSDSSEPEEAVNKNSGFHNVGEQASRRSSRSKRNVSYKENINDIDIDDDGTPSKPAEKKTKTEEFDDEKSQKDRQNLDNEAGESENENDDDKEETESEPETFECPDAEFSDFEKDKKEENFKAGQIWACYDTEDTMPRFYALIKKISPGFKLQIQWFKPDPVTKDEKKWVNADLPVSCGRYKHEKNDKSEDIFSFSHLVVSEAGQKVKEVNIHPRKGETWAVFKNWSMNWYTLYGDDEERKFEYEFVEVLSDFDEKMGVRVSYLEKVKGFVCLFSRKEGAEMVIGGSEKYKFAHMVPSCRMSGEERDGVPKGSFELDPAALPASVFQ